MSPYQSYLITPQQHGLDVSAPAINAPFPFGYWGSLNFRVWQRSLQKPWGYATADRSNLGTLHQIILFQLAGGTRHTCYLNTTDLMIKETAAGKTWSYKTELITYTSKVASISGKVVTLIAGETPSTDGVEDGDYFILTDDFTAAEEPHKVVAFDAGDDGTGNIPDISDTVTASNGASGKIKIIDITSGTFAGGNAAGDLILTTCSGSWVNDDTLGFTDGETAVVNGTSSATWASVASADDSARTITLDNNYPGTVGTGWTKTGYIRKAYTTPTDERMAYCVLRDRLVFASGDIPVQSWTGSNYSSALDATNANKARNCIAYANRLIIADHGTTRDPVGLAWSVNGNPADWTGTGSGSVTFLDADDFITALGVVGVNLVVYRRDSLLIGYQTGVATPALSFPLPRKGIGCVSPYSIVEANNTNYFVGTNDFYVMDGDMPISIGERIRDKFFSIVGPTELEKVVGYENTILNEILWLANTSEGKFVFAYDYKRKEWNLYQYGNQDVISFGMGAK